MSCDFDTLQKKGRNNVCSPTPSPLTPSLPHPGGSDHIVDLHVGACGVQLVKRTDPCFSSSSLPSLPLPSLCVCVCVFIFIFVFVVFFAQEQSQICHTLLVVFNDRFQCLLILDKVSSEEAGKHGSSREWQYQEWRDIGLVWISELSNEGLIIFHVRLTLRDCIC